MPSITVIFSDGTEIKAGSPDYSLNNYTLKLGDKCMVKSPNFHQYRTGEFTGSRGAVGRAYIKFDDNKAFEEVDIVNIVPY